MLNALKNNLLVQYTAISFVVVLLFTLFLGTVISRKVTDHLIKTHSRVFPFVVQNLINDHPETYRFLQAPPGAALPVDVERFLSKLTEFGAIFRVKVWGPDGTILWSNDPMLVGQNFRGNENFRQAMLGEVKTSVKLPQKEENLSEQGRGEVLEIYTPVTERNQVVGVVELYESDRDLFLQISRNTRTVWEQVFSAGAVLYLLLFAIFFRSHRLQKESTFQLIETQQVTISALAYQAEIHDLETGFHLDRTTRYLQILAETLARLPKYTKTLTPEVVSELVKSSPLHDIGKVGVSDVILRKPGKLNEEEIRQMQQHCEYGAAILKHAENKLSFQSFLSRAVELVLYHHEKWDGTGYPYGLKGEAIPLGARIMALADVYDALRSKRYYKEAMPHEQCRQIIIEERGEHFDPDIVDAFLGREQEFSAISEQYADAPTLYLAPKEIALESPQSTCGTAI